MLRQLAIASRFLLRSGQQISHRHRSGIEEKDLMMFFASVTLVSTQAILVSYPSSGLLFGSGGEYGTKYSRNLINVLLIYVTYTSLPFFLL